MPDTPTDPYAAYGGQVAPTQSAAPDPYAAYGGNFASAPPQNTNPAAQPGAYQQSKGAPIHSAVMEAENPFTEGTTSVLGNVFKTKPTGAIMKREGESDSQLLARVKEAAKHVTPGQIEEEERANNARALPTLAGAAVAGPATLAAEAGAGEAAGLGPEAYGALKEFAKTPLGKEVVKWMVKGAVTGTVGAGAFKFGHKLLELL